MRRKKKKEHLIRGWVQIDEKPISKDMLTEKGLSKGFKDLLQKKGVYILYKKRKHKHYDPIYVGIGGFGKGENLYSRLHGHTKDKHKKNKWDHFSAFIMHVSEKKKRYLKDIEGVLIRVLRTAEKANKLKPHIKGQYESQKQIKSIIKAQYRNIKLRMKEISTQDRLRRKKEKKELRKMQNKYRGKMKQMRKKDKKKERKQKLELARLSQMII